jgi:hypothetical protein
MVGDAPTRYSGGMRAQSFFRLAPATFIGMQEGFGKTPPIELFTLKAPVGEHPAGSTVSRHTLERHGFFVPTTAAQVDSVIRNEQKPKDPPSFWGMATA